MRSLLNQPAPPPGAVPAVRPSGGVAAPAVTVEIGELVVRGGTLAWRDETVTPPATLDVSRIESRVRGAGWPLQGPLDVRVLARPPGGGRVRLTGRVAVDPFTADVRVTATDAELAPYQPYVPTPARVSGRANLDLAVVLPSPSQGDATARGTVALSRVDVRDGQRTIIRIEQAAATGLDVEWPHHAAVRQLVLQRPWILLERDETGALPLRTMLPNGAPAPTAAPASAGADGSSERGSPGLAITLGQLRIEDGGARLVDRAISPAFAVDLQQLALRADGLSTTPAAEPARLELTGKAGAGSLLSLHGAIGPVGGPLRVDLRGELRGFAVPRTNPYLLHEVAWEARDGWLSTTLRCRIDGDALDAKTEIHLRRLHVVRAGADDQAQARIGLPLGMIVGLMKDSQGDINIALPVGGHLHDPRFDFSEAIWSTVRNAAIKVITLPVSWIGRVHVGTDSRIQRIDVDPIPFQPGVAALTPEGEEQVTRVAAFLAQLREMRLALTPVVSARDVVERRRQQAAAAIERLARQAGLPPNAAAARLFQERFPRQPVPDSPEAVHAALAEAEPGSPEMTSGLAVQRMAAVRELIKRAGVDADRLREATPVTDAAETGGQIRLDLLEPAENSRGSEPKGPSFTAADARGANPVRP